MSPNSVFHTLLLCFISFSVQAQSYTTPHKYFINCGSPTTVADHTSRRFIGDMNTDANSLFNSKDSRSINTNPPSLNSSVRIFNQPAFYEFQIHQDSFHIVRLHFYPSNLAMALFDVSANGFFLLKNVSGTGTGTGIMGNDSASIKEFFLRLKPGKFQIKFLPKRLSIAYVNAIELFPTPPNFILLEDLPPILHTIYRVNVGGPEIPPRGDSLWRKWEQDDAYLLNSSFSRTINRSSIHYKNKDDVYFAPYLVYKTAKEVSLNSIVNDSFPQDLIKLTWSFPSRKHTHHLIRLHFYDFVSITSGDYLLFNLSIRNSSIMKFGTSDPPFHLDYLVDSDERGFVNVSVIPLGHFGQSKAFLNGVEIMEAMDEQSNDPVIIEENEHSNDPVISKQNEHLGLFVGLAVGGFVLLCILGCGIFFTLKWRKPRTSSSSLIPNLKFGLKFSLAEIKTATNNFNEKLLIGEGGFGKVYKGVMSNGMKVAVKRSQPGAGQGMCEFEREITTLSRIRHRHLVSFIGYCDERLEMILVYEFLEKGTLREHLYNSNLPHLPWKKRLEICIGAARGLHYLHKGLVGRIIHRDVKSTNILLDENLVAKVSDFGLSIAGSLDETHVSTNIKGTFGYLDPEYFRTQQLTEKSDVYSFGVLLLEVLCARLALNPTLPIEQINLANWGMRCKKLDLLEEIIDPKLEGEIEPNSLRKFSDTIEKCLQDDIGDRPTMADVLWDLEYALQLQQSAHSRMPHEDSETNANMNSSTFIQRIPSIDSWLLRDHSDMNQNLGIHLTANEVFSQMKIDNGI